MANLVGEENPTPAAGKKIFTYAFLDLEATGLPAVNKKPRITEFSLVAVNRESMFEPCQPGKTPRVLDKLVKCFYPMIRVEQKAAEITGSVALLLAC